jgi:hypothetical protein
MLDRREQRVVTVDGLQVQRLTAARRRGHRVDRDAVADPGRRVAGEDVVRQRVERELARHRHLPGKPRELEGQVLPGDAADEPGGNLPGREAVEPLPGRPAQPWTNHRRLEAARDEVGAHAGVRQHLREKLLQVEHFDAGFGERVGEGVVLLVRPSHPEDIVEAQLVLVRRCEPPQLEIGPVQQDPSQRPDLRVDEEPRRRPGGTPGTIDVLLEEAHRTLLLPPRARRHPRSALTLQLRRRPPCAVPAHLGGSGSHRGDHRCRVPGGHANLSRGRRRRTLKPVGRHCQAAAIRCPSAATSRACPCSSGQHHADAPTAASPRRGAVWIVVLVRWLLRRFGGCGVGRRRGRRPWPRGPAAPELWCGRRGRRPAGPGLTAPPPRGCR